MKITINRASFEKSFALAASFAPARCAAVNMTLVRLTAAAGDGESILEASNMEYGCRVVVAVEVDRYGACLLDPEKFAAILRESTDETLTITKTAKALTVKGNRSEYNMPISDPTEFSGVPLFTAEDYVSLPAASFRALIEGTAFACDEESSRYALGGIKFERDKNELIAIGTDGRRAAVRSAHTETTGKLAGECLFRVRSAVRVARALANADGDVKFSWDDKASHVQHANASFWAMQIEGRFPRWRDVFPHRPDPVVSLEIAAGVLHAGVRQAAIACSPESNGVDFKFDESSLVLNANTAEKGSSDIRLVCGTAAKKEVIVRLDHRFVGEFLKSVGPETIVTVTAEDHEAAVVMSAPEALNARYVIMPLSRDNN